MKKIKVAIIILNWNRALDTIECLKSIKRNTKYPDYDLICVDNGSKISDFNKLQAFCRDNSIILYRSENNLGFSEGNNLGINKVLQTGAYHYLVTLNNDTTVNNLWLKRLVDVMENNRKLGSAQSLLLFSENKNIINNAGIAIQLDGSAYNRRIYQNNSTYDDEEIFGACAAAALYRTKALEQVGLFDKSFFCYMEDVDLAWRLRLAGWESLLVANSVVYHTHSASSKGNEDFKHYLIVRNTIYTLIKNYPLYFLILWPINRFITILNAFLNRKVALKATKESGFVINQIKYNIFHLILFPYYVIKLWKKRRKIQLARVVQNTQINYWLKRFAH